MKYKVVFLPEAMSDSYEIRLYLSQYYQSTFRNFFDLLKKRICILRDNPYIAQEYPDRPSYRRLVIENYVVFYKVNETTGTIEIHRILNGSRDISRYI